MNVVMIGSGGEIIKAHDPRGAKEAKKLLPDSIQYMNSIEDAIKDADAIVLMTEWNQCRGLDLDRVKSLMKGSVFVDFRNVYERSMIESHGFNYASVGC